MNEFANVLDPYHVIRRDRPLPGNGRRDRLLQGRFGMDYVRMTDPVQIWCDTGRAVMMTHADDTQLVAEFEIVPYHGYSALYRGLAIL